MNLIAWLEFELTYYDITVQHVNHNDTEILPQVAVLRNIHEADSNE